MLIDGSYADIASVLSAVAAPFVKPLRAYIHRKKEPDFRFAHNRSSIIVDILHGAAIVPFFLLIGCVFSSELLTTLQTNHVILGLAGMMGVVFVAGEIGKLSR